MPTCIVDENGTHRKVRVAARYIKAGKFATMDEAQKALEAKRTEIRNKYMPAGGAGTQPASRPATTPG